MRQQQQAAGKRPRVVASAQGQAARAEVAARRVEWEHAKVLMLMEARLMREAFAAAYNMTLAEWNAGGSATVALYDPNQPRDSRGRWTSEGGGGGGRAEIAAAEKTAEPYAIGGRGPHGGLMVKYPGEQGAGHELMLHHEENGWYDRNPRYGKQPGDYAGTRVDQQCMKCHRIVRGEHTGEHPPFLVPTSHTFCPDCYKREMEAVTRRLEAKRQAEQQQQQEKGGAE